MADETHFAKDITPICAFDVMPDGRAIPAPDTLPTASEQAAYRWLHFDLNDPNLKNWVGTHVSPIAGAALLQSETRPRCDIHEDGIILNLRVVNANPGQDADDMVSLRLWVSKNLIISARIRKVFAVDDLRQAAETGAAPGTVSGFLNQLTEAITARIEKTTVELGDATDQLEDEAEDSTQNDSPTLAQLRKSVIKFRRYIGPQREAMWAMVETETGIFNKAARLRLRETANRVTRSVEELDSIRDRLTVLQDHLATQHASLQARNSHVLSIVAAIFLPLGFLTGLFGVNVAGMPGIDWPYAFAALAGGTLVLGILVYAVLKQLKWF